VTIIEIVGGIVAGLVATELSAWAEWAAYPITRLAARRHAKRSGQDHQAEWIDDVRRRPGQVLKLVSAVWLLAGTVLPAGWTSLNLPSLSRLVIARTGAAVTWAKIHARALGALGVGFLALVRNGRGARIANGDYRTPMIIRLALAALPALQRDRYWEELTAEYYVEPVAVRRLAFGFGVVIAAPRLSFALRRSARRH
jgi:hypothetical protein